MTSKRTRAATSSTAAWTACAARPTSTRSTSSCSSTRRRGCGFGLVLRRPDREPAGAAKPRRGARRPARGPAPPLRRARRDRPARRRAQVVGEIVDRLIVMAKTAARAGDRRRPQGRAIRPAGTGLRIDDALALEAAYYGRQSDAPAGRRRSTCSRIARSMPRTLWKDERVRTYARRKIDLVDQQGPAAVALPARAAREHQAPQHAAGRAARVAAQRALPRGLRRGDRRASRRSSSGPTRTASCFIGRSSGSRCTASRTSTTT